jgi:phage terminase large subunit-like protein
VVVDELAGWASTTGPRNLWEAVSSAVAKVPHARLVVLTTAGDPAHWSKKVFDHAASDPLWRVHEVPGPAPWLDPERVQEQRRRLPESSFRRLFLNQWTAAEDRLALGEDLTACVTLDGPLAPEAGRRYVIGLDIGLKNDRTVAAVVHAEPLGPERGAGKRVVLDRMQVWGGSRDSPVRLADVEEWLLQASRTYNRAKVVFDPWQAAGLSQRLKARGVRVEEFTFSATSVARLATTLHLLIRDHALALPPDEALLEELANVRLRETSPGVLRMDHDPDGHDDRAIALALAAQDAPKQTGGHVHRIIHFR